MCNDLHNIIRRICCKPRKDYSGVAKIMSLFMHFQRKKSIVPSHLHKSFSPFIGQPLMDIRETVTDTNNF